MISDTYIGNGLICLNTGMAMEDSERYSKEILERIREMAVVTFPTLAPPVPFPSAYKYQHAWRGLSRK